MAELKILFTGVGRRIELIQAFRQAALALNKSVKIFGADISRTAPALAYCDYTRIIEVGMKEEGYIDALWRICKDEKIDLVIPTIDTDLQILSNNVDRFDFAGTKVLISAPDKIRICRDKNLTSQFFMDCGLKAPIPVNDWKKYDAGYPAFIKPKDGSSSINAYKVEDEKQLETYALQIDDYIVQPFIEGTEYTIDVFCDIDGTPLSIVPRERVQVRAGEVLKTKIFMDETMISEARNICDKFKPCGPLTIQLIRDSKTGEDYFIEINPRFGGGSPLSMKAGGRSAEAVLKIIDFEETEYYTNIKDEAVYSRFDQSVCVKSGQGKIKGVIFDLDDTLYSEMEYVKSGFMAVAEYLGDRYLYSSLKRYFRAGEPAIDMVLKDLNREDEKEKVVQVYRQNKPELHLYDGVMDLISELKANNIKVGIITDGRPDSQRYKLKALGLDKVVDDVIVTDELGGVQFRKPCDIAFRIIQTKWRINASDIVYIGDNLDKDFQAPRQLGMQSIRIANKEGVYYISTSFNDVDQTINSFGEVRDCLDL